jgi:hypothetical protein
MSLQRKIIAIIFLLFISQVTVYSQTDSTEESEFLPDKEERIYTKELEDVSVNSKRLDTLSQIIDAFNKSDLSFLNRFINPINGLLIIDYDGVYPTPTFIYSLKSTHFIKRNESAFYQSMEGEFTSVHFTCYNSIIEFSKLTRYLKKGNYSKGSLLQLSCKNDFLKYKGKVLFDSNEKAKIIRINAETNYLLEAKPINIADKYLYLYFSVNIFGIYLTAIEEN